MGLQDSVSWYQKKIGTYDKQQWEKTVEQRVLHGLTHVLKKTAKLKTDLIDVDLVRGSSFPKAKPKHGLITVTKLALIRWLLLPLYSYWWVQQTCLSIFGLLLFLYILQFCNMIVYFSCQDDQLLEHVSAYEVIVPAAMMLILSIIHSQIVSTNNGSSQDLLKIRSKRTRRTKRRGANAERSRNFSFDSKNESYSGAVPSTNSYLKGGKRHQVGKPSENQVRRRNIAWGPSLQEPSKESDPSFQDPLENVQRSELRDRETTPADDDGFESLNSNGSSENGEENQDLIVDQKSSDDEISSEKRTSFKKINFLIDDSVVQLEGQINKSIVKNTCDESNGALNKDNECRVSELYKLHDSRFNVRNQEVDEPCELSTKAREAWVREVLNKREDETSPVLCRRQSAPGLCLTCETCDHETDHKDTDSDGSNGKVRTKKSTSPQRLLQRRRGSLTLQANAVRSSCYNSSCESDDENRFDGPHLTEGTTSAAEWIGITTNSEECSVTSEIDESESHNGSKVMDDHPFAWEFQLSPSSIMSPSCAASDKVSCTIWENKDVKRADLSVLDISSAIIARVETMRENMDYFYAGLCISVVISLLPSFCRLIEITNDNAATSSSDTSTSASPFHIDPALSLTAVDLTDGYFEKLSQYFPVLIDVAFGSTLLERVVILTAMFERLTLAALFFFLVAVAERTFKQRFLYAKLFSRLTSFRRARKSELPHFRLNKVRNIKTWLSVRSYLKKRGPQRSVDVIVSAAFIITLLLLSFLSVELLKDSVRLHSEYNLEALVWCIVLGIYLLRFMTLGNKTNRKYRNLSVLLTEQINLYLQIEQKPNKKDELMVANSVLKLAADLLKELESPFKISGLAANPYVYTITKVVILSALSGVLSEMLGFKLKLHKIKIK